MLQRLACFKKAYTVNPQIMEVLNVNDSLQMDVITVFSYNVLFSVKIVKIS